MPLTRSQIMARVRGNGNKSTEEALVRLFRQFGIKGWRRTVAVDAVQIERIEGDLVYGIAGIDPPEERQHFVLHLNEGTNAEPGASPNDGLK